MKPFCLTCLASAQPNAETCDGSHRTPIKTWGNKVESLRKRRERDRVRYQTQREKRIAQMRDHYLTNRERRRAEHRAYYAANRERINAKRRGSG